MREKLARVREMAVNALLFTALIVLLGFTAYSYIKKAAEEHSTSEIADSAH